MNKKSFRKKSGFAKVVVLVFALIVLAISLTYAYFTANISGTPSTTTLKSGNLVVETDLESANAINNSKMSLINESAKEESSDKVTFYVTNTKDSTVSAKYYIYLDDITLTKNLYSEYLKWELLKNDSVIYSGTFKNAIRTSDVTSGEADNVSTTAEKIQLNTEALTLDINSTDNLVFRMWLENDPDVNQLSLTEGAFAGRLYIEAVPLTNEENNS